MEFLQAHHVSTDSESSSLGARAISAVETDTSLVLSEIRRHWHAAEPSDSPVKFRKHRQVHITTIPYLNEPELNVTPTPNDCEPTTEQSAVGTKSLQKHAADATDVFPRFILKPLPDCKEGFKHLERPYDLGSELDLLREAGKAIGRASLVMSSWVLGNDNDAEFSLMDEPVDEGFCVEVQLLGFTQYAYYPELEYFEKVAGNFQFIQEAFSQVPVLSGAESSSFWHPFTDQPRSLNEVNRRLKWIETQSGDMAGIEKELGVVIGRDRRVFALRPRCRVLSSWWQVVHPRIDFAAAAVEEIETSISIARALAEPLARKFSYLSRALIRDYLRNRSLNYNVRLAVSAAWQALITDDVPELFAVIVPGEHPRFDLQVEAAWLEARIAVEHSDIGAPKDPVNLEIRIKESLRHVEQNPFEAVALKALLMRTEMALKPLWDHEQALTLWEEGRDLYGLESRNESLVDSLNRLGTMVLQNAIRNSL